MPCNDTIFGFTTLTKVTNYKAEFLLQTWQSLTWTINSHFMEPQVSCC